MNSSQNSNLELIIWKEIAGKHLSPSHDRWHLDRVLEFARQLHAIYGGDWEVITAAVIMHDLGRKNPKLHGEDSVESSLDQAQEILSRTNFPLEKTEQVLLAIREHDKPHLKPTTIEAKILKDADFLAGFGPWGILRIATWAGETGGGVGQMIDRLENRMQKRLQNLEFPESTLWAKRETWFVRLFLSLLKKMPELPSNLPKGKYIVLEGISGSGKDTQAKILQEHLEKDGYNVLIVSEPTDVYKNFRDSWKTKHNKQLDDRMIMRFLLMADRCQLMDERVKPFINNGGIVISIRNFISTLVYQSTAEQEDITDLLFAHKFVVLPDLLILYDVDCNTSYERIKDRKLKGLYETRDQLDLHRRLYLEITKNGLLAKSMKVLDAQQTVNEIAEQTLQAVRSCLLDKTTVLS
jgi:dTMP kinase